MANNTDWLNISQMTGGTGETALSLTALTNSSLQPKTATITARNSQYNVSDTTTVTIQGFQPTLTLSRSTLRFDSTGGTATFTVYSNTAWTINFPALVHSYSTSAGTGDTEVTVVLAKNLDEVGKVDTGTVQDIFGVNQLYLTIVQESFITELTVTPDDDIIFVNTGSGYYLTIDTNTDWELECPDWVYPTRFSGGSGTTTIFVAAGENGPTDRSGEIIVYAGSKSVTINVFQPFYIPAYLTVTPSAWTFNYTEDGKTFIVDSYPEWTAEIVSTGETVWTSDTYMEAVFDIPSAMTMPLWVGNSGSTIGTYLGPIMHYGSSVTFESGGTYIVRYEMRSNGTTPILRGNQYLKEIILSDNVGAIETSAFTGCMSLSSVTIGSGLSRVGAAAFSGCSSLANITITAPTAPSISSNTFYGVITGGTLNYPASSDYSSWLSVNQYYLGYYFWGGVDLSKLQKVATLTYDVTTTTAETPIFASSATAYGSDKLAGVMDNGHFTIFTDRTAGHTGYTFSSTGKQTLDVYCWKGASDYLLYLRGPITDMVLHQLPAGKTLITTMNYNNLTAATINAKGEDDWFWFRNVKKMSLGGNASLLTGATSYTLSVTNLDISSSSITELPNNYFSGRTTLTALTLSGPITTIGQNAFRGCSNLKTVTFPDTISTLGTGAFSNCSSLKTLNNLFDKAVTISNSCFASCGIESLFIGSGVVFDGYYCFSGCSSLSTVTFEPGLTSIGGEGNFKDCVSLTSVTVPDGVEEIGNQCFYGCTSLSSVVIGNNETGGRLRYISRYAFRDCSSLSSITSYNNYVPNLGVDVFSGVATGGTLYYTNGDYSSWFAKLPSGWTGQEI